MLDITPTHGFPNMYNFIGNTITKVCLVDTKIFNIKKIFYFNSKQIKSKR